MKWKQIIIVIVLFTILLSSLAFASLNSFRDSLREQGRSLPFSVFGNINCCPNCQPQESGTVAVNNLKYVTCGGNKAIVDIYLIQDDKWIPYQELQAPIKIGPSSTYTYAYECYYCTIEGGSVPSGVNGLQLEGNNCGQTGSCPSGYQCKDSYCIHECTDSSCGINQFCNKETKLCEYKVGSAGSLPETPAPALPLLVDYDIVSSDVVTDVMNKNQIRTKFKVKNTGILDTPIFIIEQQVRPKGQLPLGLLTGEGLSAAWDQKTCDPQYPENVHKEYKLGVGDELELELISPIKNGEWDVWLISRNKCWNTEPTGNIPTDPFPNGQKVATVDVKDSIASLTALSTNPFLVIGIIIIGLGGAYWLFFRK